MKDQAESICNAVLVVITITVLYVIVAGFNYDSNYWGSKCYESHYVTEIHKAHHRTVWVTLSNGEEQEIYQPIRSVFPGSEYCVDIRYERNDEPLSWWMLPVKMFE